MEKQRPVSDRIRPILEAMERSIDSARRRRCQGTDNADDRTPTHTGKVDSGGTHSPNRHEKSDLPRPSSGDDSPPRLKARPKRPMNLKDNSWRSAS